MDQVHSVNELLQRAAERGMPLEKMRFFINEDRHEPRCFGIYQDDYTGHWVVYKNKSDGSRAVRYSGPDEAYAAQEIWAKINSEIELRRAKAAPMRAQAIQARRQAEAARKVRSVLILLAIVALIAAAAYIGSKQPHRGYYLYDGDVLYYQNSYWYYFDDLYDDWSYYDAPAEDGWYEDAWYGAAYPFEDSGDAFYYSDYYVEPSHYSSSSDYDSDYDYDYDSWDSFDTDWDSDW